MIKLFEQEKASESCINMMVAQKGHLNQLLSFFETTELLEILVHLARTQVHGKADEYAAALEEVKTRQSTLDSTHLQ